MMQKRLLGSFRLSARLKLSNSAYTVALVVVAGDLGTAVVGADPATETIITTAMTTKMTSL